jgi:hypothetical protein
MNFTTISVYTHIFAIYVLLGIMIFNYISLLKVKDFVTIAKRLKFMTPAYHGLNFTVAYTGAIVSAYSHDISPTVIFMILSTILIMILEIKRYKKMRVITSTNIQAQEEFIIYAKKIYAIEIIVVIVTFVLVKIF